MQFLQPGILFVYTIIYIYIGIVRGFQRASGLNIQTVLRKRVKHG